MIGVVVLPHRDGICGLDGGRACGGGLDMCRRGGSELFDGVGCRGHWLRRIVSVGGSMELLECPKRARNVWERVVWCCESGECLKKASVVFVRAVVRGTCVHVYPR
jgi:hypothetical protein